MSTSACDYIELATEGVKGLHPYQPGKPIEELERELGLTEIVKLASNENPLGISPLAAEAVQKTLQSATLYPDGTGFLLKQALATKLGVELSAITLGNGSNDVLDLITRAYASPESEVIYAQYAFAVYALSTQSVNAKAVVVPAKDWGHDLNAMFDAITDQTSLIFIANPNNPTGTYLKTDEIKQFLARVPRNIIVVLDEAYCEYIDQSDYPDGISLLQDYPNLIVTRTFSKAWGLASLRVGYSFSHPDLADLLNRVRQPFNVDTFALEAATAVLADDAYIQLSRKTNSDGMQQLVSGFEKLGLEYIPSVGNFVTFDTGQDGVDADVFAAAFHGGGAGETDHRVLGGGVGADLGPAADAGHGAGVDDGTATAFEHCRNLVLHAQPGIGQAHFYRFVELFTGEFVDGAGAAAEGGAVAGDIEPPKFLEAGINHRFDLVFLAHIALDEQCPATAGIDVCCSLAACVYIKIGDDDCRPFAGVDFTDCAAYTTATTRYQAYLVCQNTHGNSSVVFKASWIDCPPYCRALCKKTILFAPGAGNFAQLRAAWPYHNGIRFCGRP